MYYLYELSKDSVDYHKNKTIKWIVTKEKNNHGYYVHYYFTKQWYTYDSPTLLNFFKDSYMTNDNLKKKYITFQELLEDIPELMLL